MHSLVDCNWTYNKLEIALDELDPDRKWCKNLNWKTWLFGVAENALNLILLIIKRYLLTIRIRQKHFFIKELKIQIYWHILSEHKFMNRFIFDRKWKGYESLVQQSLQYGSEHVS